jgi:hypothetical protein
MAGESNLKNVMLDMRYAQQLMKIAIFWDEVPCSNGSDCFLPVSCCFLL